MFMCHRGKTVVHWQAPRVSTKESLWQLCCLNDRFALDGLSPPSYGGVLWCYGWQDKPAKGNRVSEKWAYRYRTGPSGFRQAKELLLEGESPTPTQISPSPSPSPSISTLFHNRAPMATGKRKGHTNDGTSPRNAPSPAKKKAKHLSDEDSKTGSKSILSYFSPTGAQQIG